MIYTHVLNKGAAAVQSPLDLVKPRKNLGFQIKERSNRRGVIFGYFGCNTGANRLETMEVIDNRGCFSPKIWT